MTIKWQKYADRINRAKGTNYTVKDFLTRMYQYHGSVEKTANRLGISGLSLRIKMRELEIPIRRQKGNLSTLLKAIPIDKIKKMTAEEIRKATGCAQVTTIHSLCRTLNLPYRKLRPPELSKEKAFAKASEENKGELNLMTLDQIMKKFDISKRTAFRFTSMYNVKYEGSRRRRR